MADKIEIKNAATDDVLNITYHLRAADIEEIIIKGSTAKDALLNAYKNSYECKVLLLKNKRIGIYGISPKGIIWFLGTDDIEKHPFFFVRTGKKVINKWLKKHKILWNIVDSRNITHIKWLKLIGAKINYTKKIIINGVRFHPFSIVRKRENNVFV